jgi:methanogenic corrinoid protein MtbC1
VPKSTADVSSAEDAGDGMLTVGALARATGVPANTLRTWERRYGFPAASRDEAGQRLYASSLVSHVRDVAEAIRHGWRAAQAVEADRESIRHYLASVVTVTRGAALPSEWIEAVARSDDAALGALLGREWDRLGAMPFLEQRLVPFFGDLAQAQGDGTLSVHHEHQASERIRGFLSYKWRALSDGSAGPAIVCATLPGDRHDMGLHAAALVLALCDSRIVWLGADTPVGDIVGAARATGASAVALGVSAWVPVAHANGGVETVRSSLPPSVGVWVGGAGRCPVPGVALVNSWEDLRSLRYAM